ncbi:uncharacterized protein sll0103 [Phtheirospermum japonicum]|uniref:Uncharacterized protein sll0103 n=1 Tax=Phtheirospermum japonicum TaxID=374723 RepID=A0A830B8D5_9LAMI|nr:uncharacterized protein sll0103 [Phtheirospermum japonicum]
MRAVPECDAVASSESIANFAVLVGLRAPPLSKGARRAPIDLVTVLDVSGSMHGPKLDLVKRAVSFVIDNLDSSDWLSIVSFESHAQRVLPLRNMTEQGRVDAKLAVMSLYSRGGTNIVEGLTKGIRVLEERRHRNPVASIMFLSDGQGTFSFIESYAMVQDAFARCIGGLLSVVVRELCLTLRSASHGVGINSIPSGRYASEIFEQGSRGKVTVGDMYADEEKEFLINISVPVYTNDGGNERVTPLLDFTCSYTDVLSNQRVQMESAEIRRPSFPSLPDVKVKLEVDRQRNRLNAAEGFAEAQRVAETGNLKGARAILSSKRSSLLASASGQAGDGLTVKLEAEMKETEERMGSQKKYEQVGRAYSLANMNELAYQRATTRHRDGPSNAAGSSSDTYVTPNMAIMVSKSQQVIKIEDGIKIKGNFKKEKY